MIQIVEEKENDTVILHLEGAFLGEYDSQKFKESLESRSNISLIIDFERTQYILSKTISTILFAFRKAQKDNGNIILACPKGAVKSVLEMTRVNTFVPTTSTLDEAKRLIRDDGEQV